MYLLRMTGLIFWAFVVKNSNYEMEIIGYER